MSDTTICYSFPSRRRPDKMFKCLDNIRALSASKNYFIALKIDMDDTSDYARLAAYPEVIIKHGMSYSKIHAVNRDLHDLPPFDILATHSDDMVWLQHGFDMIIREHCGVDTFLHIPDGFANEKLCTYPIMHVDYYNRFGWIYNPKYKSLFADQEQTEVAKRLGRYKYINNKMILQHQHPAWGFGQPDALLKYTESLWAVDEQMYLSRKALNFDLA